MKGQHFLKMGIRTLSGAQLRELRPQIETGRVLLLSQFHPEAGWTMIRAMERNNVVTGLAQAVIVAESDSKGGTWEGATSALKQHRRVYVRQPRDEAMPAANRLLIEKGALPLPWPIDDLDALISSILQESSAIGNSDQQKESQPGQLSLLNLSEHAE